MTLNSGRTKPFVVAILAFVNVLIPVAARSVDPKSRIETLARSVNPEARVQIEEVVWSRPIVVPTETSGYPGADHSNHVEESPESFALFSLTSGRHLIYAASTVPSHSISVRAIDTSSGKVLFNSETRQEEPIVVFLSSPCICKITPAPALELQSSVRGKYPIGVGVASIVGKAPKPSGR